MFDNPKKELERLEQQLLAVEASEEAAFDEFSDEADDIDTIYEDLAFSNRSAGFNTQKNSYTMESSRYVPVPAKKRKGGWLLIVCLAIIGLIIWRMGWLS